MDRLRGIPRLVQLGWAFALWSCGGGDLTLPPTGSRIEVERGDEQAAPAGSLLPNPLIVQLLDGAGAGIAGRAVAWVVSAGGGTVTPATRITDAEGFANAQWTLGPSAGVNRVTAEVPQIGAVTFTATGTGGGGGGGTEPSASRSMVSAEPASIPAGTGISTITVTVLDEQGDPVEGAVVEIAATGSGNTLTQPEGPTGPNGIATGTLQSTTPEAKEVSVIVNGSVEVTRTARVTVTTAESGVDRLIFLVPPRDVEENEPFSVEVALVDEDGDVVPLSGIFIYVGLFEEGEEAPANDFLEGERFENTQNGIAAFDLHVSKNGRYRLRALTDDLPEYGQSGPQPYLFSDLFEVD